MDKILLEGIRLEICVGTTEEERSKPQLCGLDLALEADLRAAGRTGDLKRTVDYAEVLRTIETLCLQSSFTLLEQVAEQICGVIFDHHPVERIRLRVRKLKPFSPRLNAVGVELKRSRKRRKKRSK
ncbi:MAG: dihydroneopterin aldolase [Acidimicrobiia bacterium]|nr:dihydroneopterin aldolase [Acidimicrobiia bacterium]